MKPPLLLTRSNGTLVPGTHKYFCTICDNKGTCRADFISATSGLCSSSNLRMLSDPVTSSPDKGSSTISSVDTSTSGASYLGAQLVQQTVAIKFSQPCHRWSPSQYQHQLAITTNQLLLFNFKLGLFGSNLVVSSSFKKTLPPKPYSDLTLMHLMQS